MLSVSAVPTISCESLEPRTLLAATYYVSPTGNNAWSGASPGTAWQTIDRVNGKDFMPGDRVLFQGGKTFTVSSAKGANLLTNPGFSSGLTGWTDTLGTSSAYSTVVANAGHSGAGLRISGAGNGARAQDITKKIKPDQTYEVSAWTKSVNPGSGDRRVAVTFYLHGIRVGMYYRGFKDGTYRQTRFSFVAPRSFDKAVFWIGRHFDQSTFYVDDVSIRSVGNGILLDETDSGSAAAPVVIGSYGTGRATINAGDGIGLTATDASSITVQNLNFTGSWNASVGGGANSGQGIDFVNAQPGNTKLPAIHIDSVDVKGFQWAGIRVIGANGKSGFSDVRITNSTVHANGDNGVLLVAMHDATSTLYAHQNVYIAKVKAYDNFGIPNKGSHSGNGIQLTDTLVGTIERSVAYHNGNLSNASDGGPIGIWAFDASRITIQKNESYANCTNSSKDGGGFDLDGGVTNSVMQYNYSHDNYGAGYLLYQFSGARTWGKNILRYNISQNDARRNTYGAVTIGGGIANAVIENNTIYIKPSTNGGTASAVRATGVSGAGISVRNNILFTTSNTLLVDGDSASSAARFNGNDYWPGGASFRIRWGSSIYTSLSAWRAKGQEMSGTTATGRNVDPKLLSAGSGGTFNDATKLETLTQYKLRSDSPLRSTASITASVYPGYALASLDYFGRSVTGNREIGAAEV